MPRDHTCFEFQNRVSSGRSACWARSLEGWFEEHAKPNSVPAYFSKSDSSIFMNIKYTSYFACWASVTYDCLVKHSKFYVGRTRSLSDQNMRSTAKLTQSIPSYKGFSSIGVRADV